MLYVGLLVALYLVCGIPPVYVTGRWWVLLAWGPILIMDWLTFGRGHDISHFDAPWREDN